MKLFKSLPRKYLIEIKFLLKKLKKHTNKTSFENLTKEYIELEIDNELLGLDTSDKKKVLELKKKIKNKITEKRNT